MPTKKASKSSELNLEQLDRIVALGPNASRIQKLFDAEFAKAKARLPESSEDDLRVIEVTIEETMNLRVDARTEARSVLKGLKRVVTGEEDLERIDAALSPQFAQEHSYAYINTLNRRVRMALSDIGRKELVKALNQIIDNVAKQLPHSVLVLPKQS